MHSVPLLYLEGAFWKRTHTYGTFNEPYLSTRLFFFFLLSPYFICAWIWDSSSIRLRTYSDFDINHDMKFSDINRNLPSKTTDDCQRENNTWLYGEVRGLIGGITKPTGRGVDFTVFSHFGLSDTGISCHRMVWEWGDRSMRERPKRSLILVSVEWIHVGTWKPKNAEDV